MPVIALRRSTVRQQPRWHRVKEKEVTVRRWKPGSTRFRSTHASVSNLDWFFKLQHHPRAATNSAHFFHIFIFFMDKDVKHERARMVYHVTMFSPNYVAYAREKAP